MLSPDDERAILQGNPVDAMLFIFGPVPHDLDQTLIDLIRDFANAKVSIPRIHIMVPADFTSESTSLRGTHDPA